MTEYFSKDLEERLKKIDFIEFDDDSQKIAIGINIDFDDFEFNESKIFDYICQKISNYYDFIWFGELKKNFPSSRHKFIEFVISPNYEFSYQLGNRIASIKYFPDEQCLDRGLQDERIYNVDYVFNYNNLL